MPKLSFLKHETTFNSNPNKMPKADQGGGDLVDHQTIVKRSNIFTGLMDDSNLHISKSLLEITARICFL